ncbi:MAG: hypothetical protein ACREVW_05230 [Burkholderiales bacterium]
MVLLLLSGSTQAAGLEAFDNPPPPVPVEGAIPPVAIPAYPGDTDYGTRTDVYLSDDGRITSIRRHMSNDENDETRYYDDDNATRLYGFEAGEE